MIGWKTDRGRTYVTLGPPDSVDLIANRAAPGAISNQDANTQLHRTEKWRYHNIKGIGENVGFQFTYGDYVFSVGAVGGQAQFSTRQAAQKLGRTLLTLQRHIAAGTIEAPPLMEVGTVKVRLWSDRDIERARKVLAGIKPGRKKTK